MDSSITSDFRDEYVVIGSDTLVTDSSGRFEGTVLTTKNLSMTLEGPWVRVIRSDGAGATFAKTVQGGDSLAITWTDESPAASDIAERCAFYHVNRAHALIKSLDPSFIATDFQIPCWVNVGNWTNAAFDGEKLLFGDGKGTPYFGFPLAASSPTVFHEYSHAARYFFYVAHGAPILRELGGPLCMAADEGIADAFALIDLDKPVDEVAPDRSCANARTLS